MSKKALRCIFNALGHGGGTIKRPKICALLLAIGMVMCVFPSIGGTNSQAASNEISKIDLNGKNVLVTNAASTVMKIKYKKYKKTKKKVKKYNKTKKYKKVRAAYNYKKVKVRYKYKGKWRTKWIYKKYSVYNKKSSSSTLSCRCVGARDVIITSLYVVACGRCTCSLCTDYNYHSRIFNNYNPATKRWGVLKFEQGPAPKTCPEGMWYATDTDMDFCLVHGKSHDHRNFYLVPYNGVVNGMNVVNGYYTTPVKPTPTPDTNNTKSTNETDDTPVNV